ncbi:hypothetical protein ABER61_04700 [Brevibacillus formosus]|uniref:SWIM zinc finger family protein n=1 Tax=Brevibacillus formosus TaxID=54913 RepID=A0A837KSH2_9BACL|nr:hypothetical protein [Brevibacillus formosus]KLI00074.1 SWIM zinc finger family protein [Brevibacillus formosus]MED1959338.1 hypothetical protein [Brevibacillus formosus]PSJ96140.1 hypothetical protein C7R91_15690 [Brevibacillus formosus]GED56506.1 hypothetical protein BFO01nite_06380 [Brevibacillus formosus]
MADFTSEFHRFIALCNEEYLIKYANKGIYNRSIKEMEKGMTVSYEFGDDYVECALSDDSVCRLHANIDRFSCSCPSDKICKHVIIAIVYYAENHLQAGAETEEELETYKPDFSWLLQLQPSHISKAFTPAQLEEVLFRLDYFEEMDIVETSFLTMTLRTQDISVSFDSESEIGKSMCTCKAKGNCLHKLEVILRYRAMHQLQDREQLQASVTDVSYETDVVAEAKALIAEILGIGLAKLSQTICTRLELLAIAAHNGNLPSVEKDIRGIHGELNLFFQRHVKFSTEALLDRLSRVYLSLLALERTDHIEVKKQLLGSFKSKYHMVPQLSLYALGANPWETRSGYKGITYYFYSLSDQRIYTYTEARPVYYEGISFSFKDSYKGKVPWGGLISMEELSHSQVILTQAKTNREQRLSSSEETQLTIVPRDNIEELDLGKVLVRDWSSDWKDAAGDMFETALDSVFLLKAKKFNQVDFDQKTQQLILTIEDEQCDSLPLSISYQGEFARNIRHLEQNKRLLELRDVYLLVQKIGDGLYPISIMQGKSLTSFKLDL